jgi:predicted transcriptional regulator
MSMTMSHPIDISVSQAVGVARTFIAANPGTTPDTAMGVFEAVLRTLCPTAMSPPAAPATTRTRPAEAAAKPRTARAAAASPKAGTAEAAAGEVPAIAPPCVPFMPVADSISPDGQYIFCLVDGNRMRMLKRYLRRFDLTPETYRERYGLPADYPMTAPGYSEIKRREALSVGLGTIENKTGANLHRDGAALFDLAAAA